MPPEQHQLVPAPAGPAEEQAAQHVGSRRSRRAPARSASGPCRRSRRYDGRCVVRKISCMPQTKYAGGQDHERRVLQRRAERRAGALVDVAGRRRQRHAVDLARVPRGRQHRQRDQREADHAGAPAVRAGSAPGRSAPTAARRASPRPTPHRARRCAAPRCTGRDAAAIANAGPVQAIEAPIARPAPTMTPSVPCDVASKTRPEQSTAPSRRASAAGSPSAPPARRPAAAARPTPGSASRWPA